MQLASRSDEVFALSGDPLLWRDFHDQCSLSPIAAQPLPASLKLRSRRPSPNFTALIDLFINNEAVRLNLESASLPCAYKVGLPLSCPVRPARRYNDLMELRFSFQVRHSSVKARNLYLSLRFPWGTSHYLGPLAQKSDVFSARFVRSPPAFVTVIVDMDMCIPPELISPLPCEMLLKEHVKTILENDDFCGSIAAAHVQNLVRDLPFYEAAMRRFRTWSEYVTLFGAFYHSWETVQYDDDEHAALGLSSLTPPGELRLVANCFSLCCAASDVHRDQIKWRALCDFRDVILKGGGELCLAVNTIRKGEPAIRLSRNLMRALGNEGSFRTLNSVNYLHVLEDQVASSRVVLFCEEHPVQVDRCRLPMTSGDLLLTAGSS